MTKDWPHDGSYPWIRTRGDRLVIEWHASAVWMIC